MTTAAAPAPEVSPIAPDRSAPWTSELPALAALLFLLFVFSLLASSNYVLFHSVVELFSIVVALSAFVVAWNGRDLAQDHALVVLGAGLAAAAVVDGLHIIAYPGLALLQGNPVDTAVKYWVVGRLVQAVALLAFPLSVGRRLPPPLIMGFFGLLAGLPVAAINLWPDRFTCWRPGSGLTTLKLGGEGMVIALIVVAALVLHRRRHLMDGRLAQLILASMAVTVLSEVSFTQYLGWDDGAVVTGHLLKVAAFWLIYRGIVYEGLHRPLQVLGGRLAASEARYRQIFERSLAPKLVIDPRSGALVDANEAACAFYGAPRTELLAMRIQDINVLSEVEIKAAMARAVSLEERFFRFRHRLPGSGEVRDVEVYSGPVDEGGRTLLQSIVIDVTDRIRAEEDRRRLLEEAHEARRLEALGRLAGGVAHDFNNILAAIAGSADLARDADDDEYRRCLDDILHASARARDLVRQILDFARRNDDEHRPLNPAVEIQEALAVLRPAVPGRVTLTADLGPPLTGVVEASSGQIQQVVLNLVTNAFQAVEDRGGTVAVALRPVDLAPNRPLPHPDLIPGPHALLTVSDDGPGVPPDVRPHIFEPFFTTRKQGRGTGLGLAVVHGVVSALGGAVLCLENAGPGSAFAVYLPLTIDSGSAPPPPGTSPSVTPPPADPAPRAATGGPGRVASDPPPPSTATTSAALPRGTETILVVDDEAMVGNVVARILGRLGYRVIVHEDPSVALEELRATPHLADLLVTDHTMPTMTGLDLAREARRVAPGLPVVLLSGYADVATPEARAAAGVTRLLGKPLDRGALAWAVRESLDGC